MIVSRYLGSNFGRIYRISLAVDDKVDDSVFAKSLLIVTVQRFPLAGLIFSKEQFCLAVTVEKALAQIGFGGLYHTGMIGYHFQFRPWIILAPRPSVAKPEGGQQVNL